MRIGIDARLYGTKYRGLGRYIKKLVDGVIKLDNKNYYVIFLTNENYDEFSTSNKRVKKVLMNARWYSLKEQILVPWIIKKEKVDLMHFPHFNVPLRYNKKYIVTIHDLIIDHFPDSRATNLPKWQYSLKLKGYKRIMKHAVAKANKIIVPSEFGKVDLVSLYQVPQEKISVIYEGYFLDKTQAESEISRFNIDKPYLLYVGSAYPHKNLDKLLEVFNKLNKQNKYQLVFVGEVDEFYRKLQKKVNNSNVIFTGYVSESELKTLYQNSLIYVFPSLYEGFGLPPLEAQAHSVPVISSNKSCLVEILKDSVIYFDPNNESDMFDKIDMLLSDKNLREELIVKGLENIKAYSWNKMVNETNILYKK
ncbi:glycosyltransferase family 4 protein [bacterium]|jgi:glycosyltransferase involved in cell wall biosynthesis|nr:glycosyltransferase family 4 protein [bacterium]MBT4335448.1 glycosyltransferase family 4 protein [bacterium]MBT4495511.1 glycosyltransferase family 4 protein [bacterium]MBT4764169.1 glycosyltransferase family 4 protein [bacterium]MBT5401541.1 glycosyltransferase family 4 protein [bacterium]